MSLVEFAALTAADAGRLQSSTAVGLIHLGSVEQHGPHLPLATDVAIGEALGRAVALRIDSPVVVTPRLPIGLSDHHLGFPGTVSGPRELLVALIDAYLAALRRLGITRVGMFSAHGGNFRLLEELENERNGSFDLELATYSDLDEFLETMMAAGREAGLDPSETDVHAGVLETSVALHLFPELVQPFETVNGYVRPEPGWRRRLWLEGIDSLSETGVLGDPREASARAGGVIFEALVQRLATWLAARFDLELVRSRPLLGA